MAGVRKDLQGTTVLEIAGLGPTIRCGRALADLGARWVRVIRPEIPIGVEVPWYCYGGPDGVETLQLDLRTDEGRGAFLLLVRRSDVVLEGMRPGAATRLGVGYTAVAEVNPAVVYCSITGYGQDGPYAHRAGHDLNYQALAGSLALASRRIDGAPALPGMTVADSAGGGWHAALRVLAALLLRTRTGEGSRLDVSVAEGVIELMSLPLDEHLATGIAPKQGGTVLTGRFACYDLYGTADGRWLAVGALESRFFRNLCRHLGVEDLADLQYVEEAQVDVRFRLAAEFCKESRDSWVEQLADVDCCVSPVLEVDEVIGDPHWNARGDITGYSDPTRGQQARVRALGRETAPTPIEGRSARSVLSRFGLLGEEIDGLIGTGAVIGVEVGESDR
jgi:alpha-methylacyl-CoA racemase